MAIFKIKDPGIRPRYVPKCPLCGAKNCGITNVIYRKIVYCNNCLYREFYDTDAFGPSGSSILPNRTKESPFSKCEIDYVPPPSYSAATDDDFFILGDVPLEDMTP